MEPTTDQYYKVKILCAFPSLPKIEKVEIRMSVLKMGIVSDSNGKRLVKMLMVRWRVTDLSRSFCFYTYLLTLLRLLLFDERLAKFLFTFIDVVKIACAINKRVCLGFPAFGKLAVSAELTGVRSYPDVGW